MVSKSDKTKADEAFSRYCSDPVVQQALAMSNGTLNENLLRDSFMHGAKYAVGRCEAEHHTTKAQ